MIRKISMAIRGLFFCLFQLRGWKKLLVGRIVHANFHCFTYSNTLILHDFVELKGRPGSIRFGEKCFIGKSTTIKADFSEKSFFQVGDNFGCGDSCFFGCAGGIKLGNDVMMGQNIRFHAQNHLFSDTSVPMSQQGTTEKGITVGDDCWFGSGCVVLDGVSIGKGCVIGANAVITKDIPDFSVVVGNPGRIIKNRKE